jgi:hypothetical protein
VHLTKEQGSLALLIAVLGLGGGPAMSASASTQGPHPHGRLTLKGTLEDGSVLRAAGVHFTPSPGSLQSVSYAWSACTQNGCRALSIPPHQPYLPSALLGSGDVGKRVRVVVRAVDVLRDGAERSASVAYRSARRVRAWPRSKPPRVDFIYGLPEASTASTRERFDFVAHANAADGTLTVECSLDGRRYSRACGRSRSYLTSVLRPGRHTLRVRAADRAGRGTTSYSWKIVPLPSPRPCSGCLLPHHLDAHGRPMSWDWQLQGRLVFRRVDMFDVDGFDTPTSVVSAIRARAGRTRAHELAVCYLSLGSWERYRPDEASWPKAALGLTLGGYPDEHWVDVRQLGALTPLIDARLRMCARKGFDGVEVDNIDGWDNHSGFPLTPQDAEAWLAQIADEAHALGMFILWKNDPYLASFGLRYFDGALSEQCFAYRECTAAQNAGIHFSPGMRCNTTSFKCGVAQFAAAGKWVGEVEYKWGVRGENGVVCNPSERCKLRRRHGNYVEVPYAKFCSAVYGRLRFAALRKYESDALNGRETFACWARK